MASPNLLGRGLDYVVSAVDYANRNRKAARKQDKLLRTMLDSIVGTQGTANYYRERDRETIDVDLAIRTAITSAWFYSGVRLIADRVASFDARPEVKQRTGEELRDIRNHAFERLLHRPNSVMTYEYMARYSTFWAFLSGNAYQFVSTPAPGVGEPQEIWPLPSNWVRPLPETLRTSILTDQPCIDYEYTIGGKRLILPGENMVHIRFANPFDYWTGLSPLTATMRAIKTDHAQQKYVHGFFHRDNAVPTAIISLPPETSPQDFEIAKEMIREQFGQGQRSAITRAGDIDVKVIAQTMEQMQVNQARTFNRGEIFAVLGVPEGLINGAAGDRLATEIAFMRNAVQPLLDLIAAEYTSSIGAYYGKDIVIKAPSVIPQDRSLAISEFTSYAPARTVNEKRKVLGLPPIKASKPDLKWVEEWAEEVPTEYLPYIMSQKQNDQMLDQQARQEAQAEADRIAYEEQMASAGDVGLNGEGQPGIDNAPPAYANAPKPNATGDLPGLQGPEHEAIVQASGYKAWVAAAIRTGQEEELKRWQKVAMKELAAGRNPGERTFEIKTLPPGTSASIRRALGKVRSEDDIKLAFELFTSILLGDAA